MQTTLNPISKRKQKIQAIVTKSNSTFLKKVVADKSGYDLDIVICAHLEIQRRLEQ